MNGFVGGTKCEPEATGGEGLFVLLPGFSFPVASKHERNEEAINKNVALINESVAFFTCRYEGLYSQLKFKMRKVQAQNGFIALSI